MSELIVMHTEYPELEIDPCLQRVYGEIQQALEFYDNAFLVGSEHLCHTFRHAIPEERHIIHPRFGAQFIQLKQRLEKKVKYDLAGIYFKECLLQAECFLQGKTYVGKKPIDFLSCLPEFNMDRETFRALNQEFFQVERRRELSDAMFSL